MLVFVSAELARKMTGQGLVVGWRGWFLLKFGAAADLLNCLKGFRDRLGARLRATHLRLLVETLEKFFHRIGIRPGCQWIPRALGLIRIVHVSFCGHFRPKEKLAT